MAALTPEEVECCHGRPSEANIAKVLFFGPTMLRFACLALQGQTARSVTGEVPSPEVPQEKIDRAIEEHQGAALAHRHDHRNDRLLKITRSPAPESGRSLPRAAYPQRLHHLARRNSKAVGNGA